MCNIKTRVSGRLHHVALKLRPSLLHPLAIRTKRAAASDRKRANACPDVPSAFLSALCSSASMSVHLSSHLFVSI